MTMKQFYEKHVYQILMAWLPSMACMILLNEGIHIGLNGVALGVAVFLWISFLRVLDYNKSYLVFRIGTGVCLVLTGVLILYNLDALKELKDKMDLLIRGILPNNELSTMELLLICLFFIAVCSLPFYLLQKFQVTRMVLAALALVLMVYMGFREEMLNLYAILYATLYVLMVFSELMVKHYVTHRKIASSDVMLHLAPLYVLFIFLILNLPVSNKPVTLHTAIVNGIKNTVTEWYHDLQYMLASNSGEYSVNMTGYSEDTDYGEIEEGKSTTSLTVTMNKPLGQTLYLRGNWKNVYTGSNWEEELEDTNVYNTYTEDKLDWNELLYAIYRYDKFDSLEELTCIDNMKVEFEDIETSSIFLPLKSTNIKAGIVMDYNTAENVDFGMLMRKGNSYHLSDLKMNYNSEKWKQFIDSTKGYQYSSLTEVNMEEYRKLLRDHNINLGLDCYFATEDIYSRRANFIKENFTALPENMGDRVAQLTKDVTADCKTPMEQCEAIVQYLKNYQYTQKPQKIPKDKDLVDTFLFETREGYCSYFATAMAVMVRTLGLPSRYAQGFAVSTGINPNEELKVSSASAHAWVEVYIEGLGWMTFDPTPAGGTGFTQSYYWDSTQKVEAVDNKNKQEEQDKKKKELEEYYKNLQKMKEKEQKEQEKDLQLLQGLLWLVGIMAAVAILVTVSYLIIRIRLNKRAEQKKLKNDQLYYVMAQILFLLDTLFIPMEQGETLHQYFETIKTRLGKERTLLLEVEAIYQLARYADREITKEECQKAKELKMDLMKLIKEKKGTYRYFMFWLKFSMMKF